MLLHKFLAPLHNSIPSKTEELENLFSAEEDKPKEENPSEKKVKVSYFLCVDCLSLIFTSFFYHLIIVLISSNLSRFEFNLF